MDREISQEIQCCHLYLTNVSPLEIQQQLNISEITFREILKLNEISPRKSQKTLAEQSQQIISKYLSGKSIENVKKELKLGTKVVRDTLKIFQIPSRPKWKIVKADEALFNNIDSEEKAYFSGWLAITGNLSDEESGYKLITENKNLAIVEHLSQLIFGKNKIQTGDKSCKLPIHNKILINFIKKIRGEGFANFIPKQFYPDFCRGIFDSCGRTNIFKKEIGFSVKHHMLSFIENLLKEIKVDYITKIEKITTLIKIYKINNVCEVLNFLYQNSSIYSEEKYQIYQDFLLTQQNKTPIFIKPTCNLSSNIIERIKVFYELKWSKRKIATELNVHEYQVVEALMVLNLPTSYKFEVKEKVTKKKQSNFICHRCKFSKERSEFKFEPCVDERRNCISYYREKKCFSCIEEIKIEKENKQKIIDWSWKIKKVVFKGFRKRHLKTLEYDEKIFEQLPYTIQELKEHLEKQFEPWMKWENWGKYQKSKWNDNDQSTWVWNLDHIKPHSEFLYTSLEDPKFIECWSLSNLRPYNAKQNILDGANRTRHMKK